MGELSSGADMAAWLTCAPRTPAALDAAAARLAARLPAGADALRTLLTHADGVRTLQHATATAVVRSAAVARAGGLMRAAVARCTWPARRLLDALASVDALRGGEESARLVVDEFLRLAGTPRSTQLGDVGQLLYHCARLRSAPLFDRVWEHWAVDDAADEHAPTLSSLGLAAQQAVRVAAAAGDRALLEHVLHLSPVAANVNADRCLPLRDALVAGRLDVAAFLAVHSSVSRTSVQRALDVCTADHFKIERRGFVALLDSRKCDPFACERRAFATPPILRAHALGVPDLVDMFVRRRIVDCALPLAQASDPFLPPYVILRVVEMTHEVLRNEAIVDHTTKASIVTSVVSSVRRRA